MQTKYATGGMVLMSCYADIDGTYAIRLAVSMGYKLVLDTEYTRGARLVVTGI